MSIYLPGFESITSSNKKGNLSALAAQLQRDPKRLCNSPARFAMWNTFSIEKNYRAPYYNPFMDINETDGVEIWEGRRSPELDFKWTEYGEGTLEPPRPQARANQSAWPNVPEKRKPHQARDIASRFDIDPIHKRMMQEAHRKFEGKLVKASATWQRHSGAIDLCSSVSSSGPDFVDEREGMFCDMKHKKMWPVCKADDESACFDLKVNVLRKGQRGDHFGTDETGVLSPASLRSYRVVETWD